MPYRITEKRDLNPQVYFMKIEAPLIARKVEPGQFVIVRLDEYAERVPFTVADFDREAGVITIFVQAVGSSWARRSSPAPIPTAGSTIPRASTWPR